MYYNTSSDTLHVCDEERVAAIAPTPLLLELSDLMLDSVHTRWSGHILIISKCSTKHDK